MTRDKQQNSNPFANLFEDAANITKAHGYDIVSKQLLVTATENQTLKKENERLKERGTELHTMVNKLLLIIGKGDVFNEESRLVYIAGRDLLSKINNQ